MRQRRFVFIVLGLLLSLHAYIGWRLLPPLALGPGGTALGILLLALSCVLLPLGLLARFIARQPLADRAAWAGLLTMGLFSSLLVLTVLRDAVLAIFALLTAPLNVAVSYAGVSYASAVAVPLLALAVTLIGFINARRRAAIVPVDVPIANLPHTLHGFTIAQISDIHVGPTIKGNYVQAIVDSVNSLNADLIAITGDLVDGSVAQLAAHTAPLAQLSARHGVYFVTGNHEYYSDAHAWIAELRRLNVQVLLNEHRVLQHDGAALLIGGVTDYNAHGFDASHRSDPLAAIAAAPDVDFKLLLAHQPRSASAALKAGFDLQLSGHTHGGQFWPWNHFVRFQQPFTAGLHRLDDLWVYISRGTGYWGPPKRFFAPSEITRIRLVRAEH
jgi:uncharacterized protein